MRKTVISLLVFLNLCSVAAWAQTATGTIVGTVTDNSGSVVAGARVVVTNTGTNSKLETATNAEGNYTAPLLPPVRVTVTVSEPPFSLRL